MRGKEPDEETRRARSRQASGRRGKRRGHGARHATGGARAQSRVFESAGLPKDLRAVAAWVFGQD